MSKSKIRLHAHDAPASARSTNGAKAIAAHIRSLPAFAAAARVNEISAHIAYVASRQSLKLEWILGALDSAAGVTIARGEQNMSTLVTERIVRWCEKARPTHTGADCDGDVSEVEHRDRRREEERAWRAENAAAEREAVTGEPLKKVLAGVLCVLRGGKDATNIGASRVAPSAIADEATHVDRGVTEVLCNDDDET